MRENNRGKLLKNDRFRAQLDEGGREALWGVIDGLVFAADLEQKRHHLCDQHHKLVFQEPSTEEDELEEDEKLIEYCPVCGLDSQRRNASGYGGYSIGQQHEERAVWISK